MWEALVNSAARGDGKMERIKLEVNGPSASVKAVNCPRWLNEFEFHNSPSSFVG